MKYNILIHAINWIWLWHIKRTLLIANALKKQDYICNIIFVTNSSNPFLIKNGWFKVEKLDYGIEDTLNGLKFSEYEEKSFLKINKIINDNKIDIVIHDTFFINTLLKERKDLKHFLILRDSDLNYLESIKNLLYRFKKIYIPHLKDELSEEKHIFLNNFKNINFINYIIEDKWSESKKNKIIISPWYWGDYENILIFFEYINELFLENIKLLKNLEIKIILWRHYKILLNKINFIKWVEIVDFVENLDTDLKNCDLFIWRGWYNTLNEVLINKCKSILFWVKTTSEDQFSRIDFFINNFKLKSIKKWTYNLWYDSEILEYFLKNQFSDTDDISYIFDGIENFINDFSIELSKKNILVFKHIFLPLSENFIHEELIWLSEVNPIIFTLEKSNLDVFKNNLELLYYDLFKQLLILDYPQVNNNDLYLKLLKFIVFILKKYKINIIYTEFLFDSYFISKIKWLIPNINIISAWRWYDVYTFLNNNYVNSDLFLNRLNKILVRDNTMYKEIEKYNIEKDNIEIVRSVMDFSKYNFVNKNFSKLDIIIWWRFTHKKGILELLDLINLLKNEKFIWNIWLFWDWELKTQILDKINGLWLNNRIKYYWFLSHNDFLIKLKEYNCYINYSKVPPNWDNEGTNNVVSENILLWNIVFSTIIWWIWEIIKDMETWIVLSGDSKEDFLKIKKVFWTININNLLTKWYKNVNKLLWKDQSIKKLEYIIKKYS